MAPLIAAMLPMLSNTAGLFCIATTGFILLYAVDQLLLAPRKPSPAVFACEPEGKKSVSIRTRLAFYLNCVGLYHEAWERYIKQATNKVIVLPGLGFHNDVILPHSSMKWVLLQPDGMFSAYDAIVELNQVMYSLGHSRFIGDPWQGHLVRTKLYNALEGMTADLSDELSYALDEYFGTDSDNWTEIDLVETLNHVTAQLAGRFTVGLPLCRSKDYINTCCEISDDFMLVGGVRGLPHILRPLVGSVMGIWFKTKIKKMKKLFEPLYHKRIAMLQHSADDPEHEEPNDYLQIMFRYAADRRQEELGSIDVMTRRLIIANFGSIHQPSLLIANTLLNIIDSDTEFNTITTLQDELIDVFGIAPDGTPDIADHSIWTKVNINRLNKADSLMRETTRLHTFGSRAMLRKVMPKDGVTTDTGVHLPQGTLISFMAHPVQMDEETFDNPNKFDPFRFSRMREMMEAKKAEAKEPAGDASAETDEVAKVGPLKFVTTGPNHLTFGHGRHACPGRFVVDFQLKMIIAHVITRYELEFPKEYNGRRPENTWIADVKLPRHAKIRVRRKKVAC